MGKTKNIDELTAENANLVRINGELAEKVKSLGKYKELYENSPIGYISIDNFGIIHDINYCGADLLGERQKHLYGSNLTMFMSSKTQNKFKEFLKSIFTGTRDASCEVVLDRAGQGPTDVYIEGKIAGERDRCLISLIDITKRKLIENLLSESEEKFRVIIETAPFPIFAKDTNLIYIACNEAFENFIGKPKEKIIGYSLYEVAPENANIYRSADEELLRNGGVQVYETKVQRFDGAPRDVIFHKRTYTDKEGSTIGIVGLFEDVTERKKSDNALLDSEKRFRSLIENSPEVILMLDKDARIIYVSPAFSRISGREESRIGRSAGEYIHPDDVGIFNAMMENVLKHPGEMVSFILRVMHKDSHYLYLECKATNMLEEPAVNGIVLNVHDITERKRGEEMLAEGLKFQQVLIDSIPYPIFIKDANARFLGCNRAYERVFNTTRQYMAGKTVLDLEYLSLEERKRFHEEDVEVIRNASRASYELPIEYADGKIHSTLYTVDGFRLHEEEPGGLIGLLVDITERKEAQETIQNISRVQSLILENSTLGISLIRHRHFEWVNSRLGELLQLPLDQIKGASTRVIFPSDSAHEELGNQAYPILGKGERSDNTVQLSRGDGSLFWCRFIGKALDPSRPDDGSIWMFEDITQRREAEEKINQYIHELKEVNATKDKFFSIIAHDIRSPLYGIRDMAKMINEEYDSFSDEELKEVNLLLYQSSKDLFELVENLLSWANAQNRKISFHPEFLNIETVAGNCISLLKNVAQKKSIEIVQDIRVSRLVYADANLLNTIIRNLLSNAIKFTPKGGTISIVVEESKNGPAGKENEKDYVIVKVTDSGVGMTADSISKLFRIDVTHTTLGTDQEKGSGLGLVLCKEFVELHGGSIWVESEPGKWCSFIFTLPDKHESSD